MRNALSGRPTADAIAAALLDSRLAIWHSALADSLAPARPCTPRTIRMFCVRVQATLVLTAMLAVGLVTGCDGWSALTEECDWSADEEMAVESVPLQDFLGVGVGPLSATCDISTPKTLYVEAHLPEGAALPADWQTRDSIGDWSVSQTGESDINGAWLCYTSSVSAWRDVAVVLWANGQISAHIRKDEEPCSSK